MGRNLVALFFVWEQRRTLYMREFARRGVRDVECAESE